MPKRFKSPQFDEGIYSEADHMFGVYSVYGYDAERNRWLVGDDIDSMLVEISYGGQTAQGEDYWVWESRVWREGPDAPEPEAAVSAWLKS